MNPLRDWARFSSLNNGQKIALMIALALSVALIWGFLAATAAREYQPLYVNISDRDGGAVLAALETLGIPHRTEAEGVISVPEPYLHEARLRLAAQGLPKGNASGFELLDTARFGASQFVEQIKYQRALEGELKRSIESFQSVKTARVHLALPRASAFLRDQQMPSASVLITPHTGHAIDAAQVAGIAHLVASSVPGLSLDRVAVIDSNGALLDSPSVATPGNATPAQTIHARQLEQDIGQRIEALLSPLSGPGNVRVTVNADIGFHAPAQTEAPISLALPNTAMPAMANAESAHPAPLSARDGNQIVPASATLRRLSVAVVLNNKRAGENAAGTPRSWSAAELKQIDTLVRQAMGFDAARGDTVSIVNSAFVVPNSSDYSSATWWKEPGIMRLVRDIARYAILFLLVIFLTLTLIRPLLRELARASAHIAEPERNIEIQSQNEAPLASRQADPRSVANVIKKWMRE